MHIGGDVIFLELALKNLLFGCQKEPNIFCSYYVIFQCHNLLSPVVIYQLVIHCVINMVLLDCNNLSYYLSDKNT
jgi:hypothetical protein